jgi:hypothetical protein
MAASDGHRPRNNPGVPKPSEDFSAFCEAEFERRLNSGDGFDEARYRKAMAMVLDRLIRLEQEGRL